MSNVFDDACDVHDYLFPPFLVVILFIMSIVYMFLPCTKCGGDGKIEKRQLFKTVLVDCPKCRSKQ